MYKGFMDRREFIKHSAAAVAATSVLATACKNGKPNDPINSQMVNDQMVNGIVHSYIGITPDFGSEKRGSTPRWTTKGLNPTLTLPTREGI